MIPDDESMIRTEPRKPLPPAAPKTIAELESLVNADEDMEKLGSLYITIKGMVTYSSILAW